METIFSSQHIICTDSIYSICSWPFIHLLFSFALCPVTFDGERCDVQLVQVDERHLKAQTECEGSKHGQHQEKQEIYNLNNNNFQLRLVMSMVTALQI